MWDVAMVRWEEVGLKGGCGEFEWESKVRV
jgi:hypothetical protein